MTPCTYVFPEGWHCLMLEGHGGDHAYGVIDALYPPSGSEIKAAGYAGVLTYLRATTKAQVEDYLSSGIGWGGIFEAAATRPLGGAPAGTEDGTTAKEQMLALGAPSGTYLPFALADFQPGAVQISALIEYGRALIAALDGLFTPGPYATNYAIQQIGSQLSGLYWQNAMDDNGVSGSEINGLTALYQRVRPVLTIPGASYDEDVVLKPIPLWYAAKAPVPTVLPPKVTVTKPPVQAPVRAPTYLRAPTPRVRVPRSAVFVPTTTLDEALTALQNGQKVYVWTVATNAPVQIMSADQLRQLERVGEPNAPQFVTYTARSLT